MPNGDDDPEDPIETETEPPPPVAPPARTPRYTPRMVPAPFLPDMMVGEGRGLGGGQKPSPGWGGLVPGYLQSEETGQAIQAALLDLIRGAGATDPALMNMAISEASRGTQRREDVVRGAFAQGGLTGSRFLPALLAAVGEGGENRIATIIANETARREQRRRSDLELATQVYEEPRLAYTGLRYADWQAQMQRNRERRARRAAMIGMAITMAATAAGGPAGGALASAALEAGQGEDE